jgi:hypothetical protein
MNNVDFHFHYALLNWGCKYENCRFPLPSFDMPPPGGMHKPKPCFSSEKGERSRPRSRASLPSGRQRVEVRLAHRFLRSQRARLRGCRCGTECRNAIVVIILARSIFTSRSDRWRCRAGRGIRERHAARPATSPLWTCRSAMGNNADIAVAWQAPMSRNSHIPVLSGPVSPRYA